MAKVEHARPDGDDGGVVAASGGVQVRKWVAVDAAAVPVVKYEVASSRDEPVEVAVTDEIPEHLDPEDIGFHDDFHGDRWRRPAPREVRFETRLGSREEVTTVYGVRREHIEDETAFQARPEVTVATGGAEGGSEPSASDDVGDGRLENALNEAAAASAEEDGDATARQTEGSTTADAEDGSDAETLSLEDPTDDRAEDDSESATGEGHAADGENVIANGENAAADGENTVPNGEVDAGDSTGMDGLETSESPLSDQEAVWNGESSKTDDVRGETKRADDVAGGAASAADATATGDASSTDAVDSGSADAGTARSGAGDGAVVDRLASELQSDGVDEETREALSRELNLQLSASSSQFVEHLQSRMKEKRGQLEGDIERLEDSIAELYGLKADSSMVQSLREGKADETALSEVSAAVDALADAKADLADVQSLQDALSELESEAATAAELDSTASDLRDRVAALDASIAEVDERTASEEGVEELAHGVSELDERTPGQSAFDELQDEQAALREAAAMDADLNAVERELADLDESLSARLEEETERFRDRLDEETTMLRDRLDDEESTRAAAVSDARERLDALEARKADAERVATLETDLERRYVTEADITESLESRLRTSLFARTLLVVAGAAGGAGVAVAASGTNAGVLLVVLGVALVTYWWKLNDAALDEESA